MIASTSPRLTGTQFNPSSERSSSAARAALSASAGFPWVRSVTACMQCSSAWVWVSSSGPSTAARIRPSAVATSPRFSISSTTVSVAFATQ